MSFFNIAINRLKLLISDGRAFTLTKIMDIVIALIFVAILLPIGLKEFVKAGDIFAEGSAIAGVWNIAPVLVVLGVVVGLVYMAIGRKGI